MLIITPPLYSETVDDKTEFVVQSHETLDNYDNEISEYFKKTKSYNVFKGSKYILESDFHEAIGAINSSPESIKSDVLSLLNNKNFQFITENGKQLIPLIIGNLDHNPYLVWALNLITGIKMGPSLSMNEAIKKWKKWAASASYSY